MFTELIISGIGLGLISSFHCMGMCGPLVFALPFNHLQPHKRVIAVLMYHAGRLSMYALLGIVFGLASERLFLAGYQQVFSIVLGVLVLVMLASYVMHKKVLQVQWIDSLTTQLQTFIVKHIKTVELKFVFLTGAANGLLPCGMIYFALTGALATGNALNGSLFMFFFGAGTLPLMFLLSQFGFIISVTTRNFMRKTVPYFIAIMGILLIMRGLNLGIPYVSPQLINTQPAVSCH